MSKQQPQIDADKGKISMICVCVTVCG